MTDPLDGRFGESWSGEVPNGSHINAVLARRGSPTAAAAATALANPRPGIVPFLACLSPGLVVRPMTVVVNKSPIPDDPESPLGPITWGAAQLGIAQGVLDAIAEGLLDAAEAGDVVILVALWVDPAADDETAVKAANREAMHGAIADALQPPGADGVRALAERREEAANIYYTGG
jgi:5,6,7,8-tetrahydromethanopterin hydro-lyase